MIWHWFKLSGTYSMKITMTGRRNGYTLLSQRICICLRVWEKECSSEIESRLWTFIENAYAYLAVCAKSDYKVDRMEFSPSFDIFRGVTVVGRRLRTYSSKLKQLSMLSVITKTKMMPSLIWQKTFNKPTLIHTSLTYLIYETLRLPAEAKLYEKVRKKT